MHAHRVAMLLLALGAFSAWGRRDNPGASAGRRLAQVVCGDVVCEEDQQCLVDDKGVLKCLGSGFLNRAPSVTASPVSKDEGRAVITSPVTGPRWQSYELQVCVQGAAPPACKTLQCPVSTTPCAISGLAPETTYVVTAVAIKGPVRSRTSQPTTFTTPPPSGLHGAVWVPYCDPLACTWFSKEKLPDYDTLGPPSYTGTVELLNCVGNTRNACPPIASIVPDEVVLSDTFASRFTGRLLVPADGDYTLWLKSDDGSRLILDGTPVIEMDNLQPPSDAHVMLTLAAGLHPITVEHFQGGDQLWLTLEWEGGPSNFAKTLVPSTALFAPHA